ncbi:MAG: hypothetical protein KA160_06015 [Lacibacter sp.]|jgi:hypothetical protein|nr:hypothetical protein [Lacibacter sp.]
MSIQEDFRKKNKPVNVKAVFDIVMGLVYLVMGAVLALSKYLGFEITFPPADVIVVFGIAAFLYGSFRIYRGVKTYNNPS